MIVHLEGMGLNGSLLARLLDRHGIAFTWHDPDKEVTAWKASTGAIYPSGSEKFGPDEACRNVWGVWHHTKLFPRLVEACAWVFNHKGNGPHGLKGEVRRTPFGLGISEHTSYHLNAQRLVRQTRKMFEDKEVAFNPQRFTVDFYIVTHGFKERLSHAYWGWTRLVKLQYDPDRFRMPGTKRPAFYFREGRFVMCYAYPVPGTPWWYSGSSLIKQKVGAFKKLVMQPKYERWHDYFYKLGHGEVKVAEAGEYLQGWRPAARDADKDWVRRSEDNVLTLRPLWNSGIRHFPRQWIDVAQHLGLQVPLEERIA